MNYTFMDFPSRKDRESYDCTLFKMSYNCGCNKQVKKYSCSENDVVNAGRRYYGCKDRYTSSQHPLQNIDVFYTCKNEHFYFLEELFSAMACDTSTWILKHIFFATKSSMNSYLLHTSHDWFQVFHASFLNCRHTRNDIFFTLLSTI